MIDPLKSRLALLVNKPLHILGSRYHKDLNAVYRSHIGEHCGFDRYDIAALRARGFLGREHNNGFNCYSWQLTAKALALRTNPIPDISVWVEANRVA